MRIWKRARNRGVEGENEFKREMEMLERELTTVKNSIENEIQQLFSGVKVAIALLKSSSFLSCDVRNFSYSNFKCGHP